MTRVVELCRRLVEARAFEYGIIAVIVANSVLLGLETVDSLNRGIRRLDAPLGKPGSPHRVHR